MVERLEIDYGWRFWHEPRDITNDVFTGHAGVLFRAAKAYILKNFIERTLKRLSKFIYRLFLTWFTMIYLQLCSSSYSFLRIFNLAVRLYKPNIAPFRIYYSPDCCCCFCFEIEMANLIIFFSTVFLLLDPPSFLKWTAILKYDNQPEKFVFRHICSTHLHCITGWSDNQNSILTLCEGWSYL